MTGVDQAVAWSVFVVLIVIARVLATGPALRHIRPHVRRLADWASARLNPPDEVDPEVEELAIIRRRQQLEAHVERLRRILATDMAMSATRQIGNRLAYAWLREELERTPVLLPAMVPTRSLNMVSHDSRRGSTVEILEIGWRR